MTTDKKILKAIPELEKERRFTTTSNIAKKLNMSRRNIYWFLNKLIDSDKVEMKKIKVPRPTQHNRYKVYKIK